MPLYEYRCQKCDHLFELFVRLGREPELKCPRCGSTEVRKAFSLFGTTAAGSASGSTSSGAACAPSG
ncbi:MAG: zinc ribbon domain-containing protein [Anaerolineae bacterium]|jgi:putative FmdB family regulatory protein|nr:zinc ribbon domain-containing protein [Anaerolineae bacterium]